MKFIFTLFTLILLSSHSFGQTCERKGQFTGGTVKGGVKLKRSKKGTYFIQMDGSFSTTEGPDLNIYLSNTTSVNESSLLVHSLEALEASQKYKIENPLKMNDYQYVIIHCTEYNHHFGTATLLMATGEGCELE